MSTYAQSQRRQTIRVLAGCALVAVLFLLAPLRVSYGERRYCQTQALHPSASFLQASEYLPLPSYGIWYGPTGARYGYATAEDSPIYPTLNSAERCS